MESIKSDQLKLLAANNGINSVTLTGVAGGFYLKVNTISGDVLLHTQTGEARLFKKADTILSYLKDELGIAKAAVEMGYWDMRQQTLKPAKR